MWDVFSRVHGNEQLDIISLSGSEEISDDYDYKSNHTVDFGCFSCVTAQTLTIHPQ